MEERATPQKRDEFHYGGGRQHKGYRIHLSTTWDSRTIAKKRVTEETPWRKLKIGRKGEYMMQALHNIMFEKLARPGGGLRQSLETFGPFIRVHQ